MAPQRQPPVSFSGRDFELSMIALESRKQFSPLWEREAVYYNLHGLRCGHGVRRARQAAQSSHMASLDDDSGLSTYNYVVKNKY
jgi:hypothetical protein